MESTCEPIYRDGTFWIYLGLVAVAVVIQNMTMGDALKSEWYKNLKKPSIYPPSYFFTTIWTIIYFLLAWSTFIGYQSAQSTQDKMLINIAFVFNLVLNILWTRTFFGNQDPKTALGILIVLIFETIVLAWLVYLSDKIAGSLFLIYIFWLIIALVYNFIILKDNKTNKD